MQARKENGRHADFPQNQKAEQEHGFARAPPGARTRKALANDERQCGQLDATFSVARRNAAQPCDGNDQAVPRDFFSFARFDLIPSTSIAKCVSTFCRLVNVESRRVGDMRTVLGGSAAGTVRTLQSIQAFGSLLTIMTASAHEEAEMVDRRRVLLHGIRPKMDSVKIPPAAANVIRGAVFFVGMSLWGSQRIETLMEHYSFAEVLYSIRRVVLAQEPMVCGEVLLSLHRLVTKYGRELTCVEWDVIVDIFLHLIDFAFAARGDEKPELPQSYQIHSPEEVQMFAANGSSSGAALVRNSPLKFRRYSTAASRASSLGSAAKKGSLNEQPFYVDTNLDVLSAMESLRASAAFQGVPEHPLVLVQALASHQGGIAQLPEKLIRELLVYMSGYTHPAYPSSIDVLERAMRVFFASPTMPHVRQEALVMLQKTLWSAKVLGMDALIDRVVVPYLGCVYEEFNELIRKRGVDLIVETARNVHTDRFSVLCSVLVSAIEKSPYEDTVVLSASGIASIMSSSFEYPPSRLIGLVDVLKTRMLTHSLVEVRRTAVACLGRLRANVHHLLQWNDSDSQRTRLCELISCSSSSAPKTRTSAVLRVSSLVTCILEQMENERTSDVLIALLDTMNAYALNKNILADVEIVPIVRWYCSMLWSEDDLRNGFRYHDVIAHHVVSLSSSAQENVPAAKKLPSRTPPLTIKSFLPGVPFGIVDLGSARGRCACLQAAIHFSCSR